MSKRPDKLYAYLQADEQALAPVSLALANQQPKFIEYTAHMLLSVPHPDGEGRRVYLRMAKGHLRRR